MGLLGSPLLPSCPTAAKWGCGISSAEDSLRKHLRKVRNHGSFNPFLTIVLHPTHGSHAHSLSLCMVAGASGGLSGGGEDECEGERLVARAPPPAPACPPNTGGGEGLGGSRCTSRRPWNQTWSRRPSATLTFIQLVVAPESHSLGKNDRRKTDATTFRSYLRCCGLSKGLEWWRWFRPSGCVIARIC
jgi:hypothetical protein